MVVYPERMKENLARSRGVVFSGTVLLELARRGVSRERAYELVQRNAMRAFHEQQDFKGLLLADPDVTALLPAAEIEQVFDLSVELRNVDVIFTRVFGTGPAPAETREPAGATRASEEQQRRKIRSSSAWRRHFGPGCSSR
jgi:adenylosuccinate lyase